MASAVLTAGHIQRPGPRDREGRHPDRRGHGAHGGSASPQFQDDRVVKSLESLRGGKLILRYKNLYPDKPTTLHLVSAIKKGINYWKVGINQKDDPLRRDSKHY